MKQLQAGRHFLIENPAGSELFQLDIYQRLWATGKVVSINIPQCALGLQVHGEPTLKNTTLWASSLAVQSVPCTGSDVLTSKYS